MGVNSRRRGRHTKTLLLLAIGLAVAATSCTNFEECRSDDDCDGGFVCVKSRAGWTSASVCAPRDEQPDTFVPPGDTTNDMVLPPGCGEVACEGELADVPGALCDETGICGLDCGSLDGNFDDCDGDLANGCEVDLAADDLHCGQCANSCESALSAQFASGGCVEAVCVATQCFEDFVNFTGNPDDGCLLEIVSAELEEVAAPGAAADAPIYALEPGPRGGALLIWGPDGVGGPVQVDYHPAPGEVLLPSTVVTGLVAATSLVRTSATLPDTNGAFVLALHQGNTVSLVDVRADGQVLLMAEADFGAVSGVVVTRALGDVTGADFDMFVLETNGDLTWYTVVAQSRTPVGPGTECVSLDTRKACEVSQVNLTTESLFPTQSSLQLLGGRVLALFANSQSNLQGEIDVEQLTVSNKAALAADTVSVFGWAPWLDDTGSVMGMVASNTDGVTFIDYRFDGSILRRNAAGSLSVPRVGAAHVATPEPLGAGRYVQATAEGLRLFDSAATDATLATALSGTDGSFSHAAYTDGHLWLIRFDRTGPNVDDLDNHLVHVPVVQH